MSDNSWRIKRYYGPRVLIDLAQLETSPFQALVLCLSGPERSIVQNLMQYAHRRSTFVSEYHDDYYLAPSEEEWDDIDALVAQLEDKLMNCEEFTQMLEDILTAAECACEAASAGYTEPYLVNYYRDLVDDGTVVYELPDGTPTVVEDDRCAVAQLVWAYQYEFLVETLQPLQEFLHTVLLAAVLGLIGTAIGGPIVGLSAASVSAFITALLKMGVDSDLENVENELLSLKEALVCAMYEEWVDGGTYADAAAAAADVINASEVFSPIDKALFRRGFAPTFMALAQEAWDEQTAWATGNVYEAYCLACEEPPEPWEYTFPPCPNGWEFVQDCACGGTGILEMMGNPSAAQSPYWWATAGKHDLTVRVRWRDNYPSPGAAIALVRYRYSYDYGETWIFGNPQNILTHGDTDWHEQEFVLVNLTIDEPGALIRWYIGKTNDYSFECNRVQLEWV